MVRFLSLVLLALVCLADPVLAADPPEPPTSWTYPPQMNASAVEVYRTVGDVELKAWIFTPPNHQPTDSRAAAVFFFGGGWNAGTPGQFYPHCVHLAKRGMVAITVDYRVKTRHQVLPQQCLADAKAALRWVRANAKRLGVNPKQVAAGGGSAGGHLAAATGTVKGFEDGDFLDYRSTPDAMLLFNPAVALAAIDGQENEFPAEKLADIDRRCDGLAKQISPFHHVAKGVAPTVIFHGTNDSAVPYWTVVEYQKLMKDNGNRCQLMTYQGQPHGFFNAGRGQGEKRAEANRRYHQTIKQLDEFLVSLGYLKQ